MLLWTPCRGLAKGWELVSKGSSKVCVLPLKRCTAELTGAVSPIAGAVWCCHTLPSLASWDGTYGYLVPSTAVFLPGPPNSYRLAWALLLQWCVYSVVFFGRW